MTAHEREVNSVAFAPSSEYLILTGSSDHVSDSVCNLNNELITHRLSPFGISERCQPAYTRSKRIVTKCSSLPGHPTRQSTLLPLPVIDEFISGISTRLGRSRLQMTQRTVRQSCCLFTAVIRPKSAISHGALQPNGTLPRHRKIIYCKCGSHPDTFEQQPRQK